MIPNILNLPKVHSHYRSAADGWLSSCHLPTKRQTHLGDWMRPMGAAGAVLSPGFLQSKPCRSNMIKYYNQICLNDFKSGLEGQSKCIQLQKLYTNDQNQVESRFVVSSWVSARRWNSLSKLPTKWRQSKLLLRMHRWRSSRWHITVTGCRQDTGYRGYLTWTRWTVSDRWRTCKHGVIWCVFAVLVALVWSHSQVVLSPGQQWHVLGCVDF